ncbi:hypothetical protein K438DRAFT_1988993 [Mycena galopus ATCC 62051]|nr:hypothetical protein K438DRAFT_1988993 [Mycena galopus ATCC 62051]
MDAAFKLVHVLTSNGVPTEQQALNIRGALETLQSRRVFSSDLEIDHDSPWYHQIPEDMQAKVQVSLRGALSVIRRFPAEILSHIFIICRDNDLTESDYTITDPTRAPILLSHVCSRWRMVALSTPRLWNAVTLLTSAFIRGRELVVEEILGRSRSVPLHVALETPSPFPWQNWIMISSVATTGGDYADRRWLDIVWNCQHRLETISMEISSEDTYPNIFPVQANFPLLSSLKLSIAGDEEPNLEAILNSFQSAPLLQALEIDLQFACDVYFLDTAFPWSQLTDLVISAPLTVLGARDLLPLCTALVSATLHDLFEHFEEDGTPPPPATGTLDNLARLDISARHAEGALVLEAITAPNLTHLSLSSQADPSIHTLLAFHARSQFPLTYLALSGQRISCSQLFSFLRLLPILETLVIDECSCIKDRLFRILTCPSANAPVAYALTLPHLTTLEIHPLTSLTGTIVADMAEYLHRDAGNPAARFPRLNRLCLYRGHPQLRYAAISKFADDIEDRLAALCATGFLMDRYKHD